MRNVGQVNVKVTADTSAFQRSMEGLGRDADNAIKPLSQKLTDLGKGFENVGRDLTKKVTLPIVALGTVAVKSFADFDDKLNQSLAIQAPEIAERFRGTMERSARDVALQFGMSAADVAESFFFLASAGLNAEQQIGALPQVAAFAKAGMFDMARATDLATDAQSALGLVADDASENLLNLERVTDVLVGANTLANASVEQFSEALTTKAGAALRVVNKDVEEGVAVLAAFADQGVKGSAAGEKLNIFLRDTARAASANSEEFEALGLSIFDADGNMRNMADIVENMEEVFGDMSDAQMVATFDMLGLNRGVADAAKQLMGTSDSIREYEAELRQMGGITQDVAERQLDSFSGQMSIVKAEITDLALDIGPMVIDQFLKPLIDNVRNAVERFSNMDESTKQLIVRIAGIAAAVGPVLIVVGKLLKSVGAVIKIVGVVLKSFALVSKVLFLVANPIGLVVVGIGLLVAGVILAYRRFETFRNIVQGVFRVVRSIVEGFVDFFQKAFEFIKPIAIGVFGVIRTIVVTVFNVIRAYLTAWFAVFRALFTALRPVVTAVFGVILGVVRRVFDAIKTVATPVIEALSAAFGLVADAIGAVLAWVGDLVGGWEGFFSGIEDGITKVGEFFIGMFESIRDFVEGAIEAITGFIEAFVDGAIDFFTAVRDFVVSAWEAILGAAEVAWNAIRTVIEAVINFIVGVFTFYRDLVLQIWTAIRSAAETAFGIIRRAWDTLTSGIRTAIQTARDIVTGVWDAIKGAADTVFTAVSTAWTTLTGGIETAITGAKDFVIAAFNSIKDTGESIFKGIGAAVTGAFSAAITGAKALINPFIRATNTVIGGLNRVPGVNIPRIPELANGAIIGSPTLALIGEAGSEAVIPLTRPRRAMELMEQSGLADMARGSAGRSGAAVNIEHATFVAPLDAEKVAQKVIVAEKARAFAA